MYATPALEAQRVGEQLYSSNGFDFAMPFRLPRHKADDTAASVDVPRQALTTAFSWSSTSSIQAGERFA